MLWGLVDRAPQRQSADFFGHMQQWRWYITKPLRVPKGFSEGVAKMLRHYPPLSRAQRSPHTLDPPAQNPITGTTSPNLKCINKPNKKENIHSKTINVQAYQQVGRRTFFTQNSIKQIAKPFLKMEIPSNSNKKQ
eukprot:4103921-Amphidinium_carterae.1